jgi:hypothetical protein
MMIVMKISTSIDGKESGKAPWEVITTVSLNSLQHPNSHPNPKSEQVWASYGRSKDGGKSKK